MSLFFKSQRQVHVYSAQVLPQNDLNFKMKATYQDVDAFEPLMYTHDSFGAEMGISRNTIRLIS